MVKVSGLKPQPRCCLTTLQTSVYVNPPGHGLHEYRVFALPFYRRESLDSVTYLCYRQGEDGWLTNCRTCSRACTAILTSLRPPNLFRSRRSRRRREFSGTSSSCTVRARLKFTFRS